MAPAFASTFTFGDALIAVLEFALLFFWIWILIAVVADIFRSHDLSGWAKASWVGLIVIVPLFGVLIYLVARGAKIKIHTRYLPTDITTHCSVSTCGVRPG